MMPEPPTDDPDEMGGGAPPWMVTYGDSITLLLTFFVLLLTFSTPNKEGMAELAKGILAGSRRLALFAGPGDQDSLVAADRLLEESRLDESGAETPPMSKEEPIAELKRHFESVDVSKLKALEGGQLIRIPVVDLFGTGTTLTADGTQVLDSVVKVLQAKSYSVVVRVEAGAGSSGQAGRQRSLGMALAVTQYLARGAGGTCKDVGLSDNMDLLGSPAGAGTCEIVMLEV